MPSAPTQRRRLRRPRLRADSGGSPSPSDLAGPFPGRGAALRVRRHRGVSFAKSRWARGENYARRSGAGVGFSWAQANNFVLKVTYAHTLGHDADLGRPQLEPRLESNSQNCSDGGACRAQRRAPSPRIEGRPNETACRLLDATPRAPILACVSGFPTSTSLTGNLPDRRSPSRGLHQPWRRDDSLRASRRRRVWRAAWRT
jgi:hypothetical protein